MSGVYLRSLVFHSVCEKGWKAPGKQDSVRHSCLFFFLHACLVGDKPFQIWIKHVWNTGNKCLSFAGSVIHLYVRLSLQSPSGPAALTSRLRICCSGLLVLQYFQMHPTCVQTKAECISKHVLTANIYMSHSILYTLLGVFLIRPLHYYDRICWIWQIRNAILRWRRLLRKCCLLQMTYLKL